MLCTSVNAVLHSLPHDYVLADGPARPRLRRQRRRLGLRLRRQPVVGTPRPEDLQLIVVAERALTPASPPPSLATRSATSPTPSARRRTRPGWG
ncbi:MAG: hypothetical protein R2734_02315 [Nocardioides sp.]